MQKTAYELRISDWSSDVCSSDLKKEGLPLEPFTVHDLRRTGSTLLNELGFNSDWIEKCLAHEDGRSSRGVYNKAEYEHQRRHMMQEWSNLVDAWVVGRKYKSEEHTSELQSLMRISYAVFCLKQHTITI